MHSLPRQDVDVANSQSAGVAGTVGGLSNSRGEGPPPLGARLETTRDVILKEAARVFGQRGFAAASIRDIAEAVGIRSASLYHHYPSKDEIYLAVSKRGVDEVFEAVRAAVNGVPIEEGARGRISAAIRAHLESALASGPFTAVNIRCSMQIPEDLRQRTADQRRPYERYWRDLFRSGIAEGCIRQDADPTILSLFVFGFMNWTADWFGGSHWSIQKIASSYCEFLFDGIEQQEK